MTLDDKVTDFLDDITTDEVVKRTLVELIDLYRKDLSKKREISMKICGENSKKWDSKRRG